MEINRERDEIRLAHRTDGKRKTKEKNDNRRRAMAAEERPDG